MRSIENIIKDKREGKDCSEAESAEIKHTVRMIQKHFPLEYNEVYEEDALR